VQLVHEFDSIEYTRQTCEELAKQSYDEIDLLGGNTYLENLIRGLMDIFRSDDDEPVNGENGHADDTEAIDQFVSDQIDDDDER
jgi:hypothetical protein